MSVRELPPKTVTLGRAAALLGVSASTARRMADDGRLATCRTPGGHRRVVAHDLERLVRERRPVRVRRPDVPGPDPEAAELLATHAGSIVQLAVGAVYEPGAEGWFAEPAGRRCAATLLAGLAASLRDGEEPGRAAQAFVACAHASGAGAEETVTALARVGDVAVLRARRERAQDAAQALRRTFTLASAEALSAVTSAS